MEKKTHTWKTTSVGDCLDPVSIPKTTKIQTRDYLQNGRYPIVDQGQEQIAGWTNDETSVITGPLPLVVFGDHTRAFKYIDFPFARGADGTQLLRPRKNIDPLYFFYACRALDLPSRGYNRHFTMLKEKEIPIPLLPEQQQIAAVLRLVEAALKHQRLMISTLKKLKQSAMHRLFTEGVGEDDKQKETEVGIVPASWSVERLGGHFNVSSGGTPSRSNPDYWVGGAIPWVKTTEVDYGVIDSTEEHITQLGLENSAAKLFPAGTILMAMYGQGVTRGKVAVLGIEAACNQACAALTPITASIESKFLFHFLAYQYEQIRQFAHGGQQQNLNAEIVRNLWISYPADPAVQKEIVAILDKLDEKLRTQERKEEVMSNLFKALLMNLISGEIPTHSLNTSAVFPSDHLNSELVSV